MGPAAGRRVGVGVDKRGCDFVLVGSVPVSGTGHSSVVFSSPPVAAEFLTSPRSAEL